MTTAREIMSGSVATILPTATVREAAQLLREHRVGALPVVDDDGRLIGTVTDRDLVVNVIANGGGVDSSIEEFGVRHDVHTVGPDASLEDVQALMGEHQVRRLPVLDGETLLGIISLADVARAADAPAVGTTTERISA
jgi:CBS domain-containing protein